MRGQKDVFILLRQNIMIPKCLFPHVAVILRHTYTAPNIRLLLFLVVMKKNTKKAIKMISFISRQDSHSVSACRYICEEMEVENN